LRRAQERQRFSVEALPILGQAAAAVEPRNGALDDPAFWQDHKAADLIGTLTILISRCGRTFATAFANFGPLYPLSDEQHLQKWKHPEQCRHDESASIAIWISAG